MKRVILRGRTRATVPIYRENSGSTMAEVLVGFAFLMILMVGFVRLLQVSSDFMMAASDQVSWQEEFQEELQKKTPDAAVVDAKTFSDVTLTFVEVKDAEGEAVKPGGASLTLSKGVLSGTTHRELNATVYQVLYMEETEEKESKEP